MYIRRVSNSRSNSMRIVEVLQCFMERLRKP